MLLEEFNEQVGVEMAVELSEYGALIPDHSPNVDMTAEGGDFEGWCGLTAFHPDDISRVLHPHSALISVQPQKVRVCLTLVRYGVREGKLFKNDFFNRYTP